MTLTEVLVAAAVALAVMGLAHGMAASSLRATRRANERGEALRAALLATDLIRQDLEHMLFEVPARDLVLLPHGASMRVPVRLDASDPWVTEFAPVSWSLRPVPGTGRRVFQLVRVEPTASRETVVRSCLLDNLTVSVAAVAGGRWVVSVEATGIGSLDGSQRATVTARVTLDPVRPAAAYPLDLPEEV